LIATRSIINPESKTIRLVKEDLHRHLGKKISQGDSASFKELFDLYYPQLFSFARKYVGVEDAQDIVATTFMRLWEQKEKALVIFNIRAFLHTATKNRCLNLIRNEKTKSHKQRELAYMTDADMEIHFEVAEIEGNIYQSVFEEIENLPSGCKKIFKLAYFKNLKNAEIAGLLNISEKTVRNQKAKALKILRLSFLHPVLILFFAYLRERHGV
jgi:RNA polymerase sigma-70 factor (ECF subfamily)